MNDKKPLPVSDGFLCEQSEALQSKNTTASTPVVPAPGARSLLGLTDVPNKIGLLLFNLAEAKNILRHQVEDNLHDNLSFPELVDHVVDYLLEVVQEDPHQKKLLGLS